MKVKVTFSGSRKNKDGSKRKRLDREFQREMEQAYEGGKRVFAQSLSENIPVWTGMAHEVANMIVDGAYYPVTPKGKGGYGDEGSTFYGAQRTPQLAYEFVTIKEENKHSYSFSLSIDTDMYQMVRFDNWGSFEIAAQEMKEYLIQQWQGFTPKLARRYIWIQQDGGGFDDDGEA